MENAHLPVKPLNVKLSVDHGFAKIGQMLINFSHF